MGFLQSVFSRSGGKKEGDDWVRTTRATADRIRNILGVKQLETMPVQAARAFQLASDPRSTASDFVSVIESDEVLSSRVIRVANSVYFFRGTPANDIEKAVAAIGLNELRCLLCATMLKSLLQGTHPAREQVWANAIAVGICSRNLAKFTQHIAEGEAFLCGLVHDVGKLVMIRRSGTEYEKAVRLAASGEKTFVEAEEEVYQTNHIEVGKWVAELWNFPLPVIKAIAGHHDPLPVIKPGSTHKVTLAQLVRAADTIAHSRGIGHPSYFKGFQRRAQEELSAVYQLLGISTGTAEQFIQSFEKQFEDEFGLYQGDIK